MGDSTMVQKVNQKYYAMGYSLMAGLLVDETLKPKLESILNKCADELRTLIKENKDHILDTDTMSVYPNGKLTFVNISAPKGLFEPGIDSKIRLLEHAFTVSEVRDVFKSDKKYSDDVRAKVQRMLEDLRAIEKNKEPWQRII